MSRYWNQIIRTEVTEISRRCIRLTFAEGDNVYRLDGMEAVGVPLAAVSADTNAAASAERYSSAQLVTSKQPSVFSQKSRRNENAH
jgi:hypothetical protein